ncbi:unnamed protein product [Agarophyton chilense]
MRDALTAFHIPPHTHHPKPCRVTPTAVVSRPTVKPTHSPHPHKQQPWPEEHADEWMMYKLDEDMSDADNAYASDAQCSDGELFGRCKATLRSQAQADFTAAAASLPAPTTQHLPLSHLTTRARLTPQSRVVAPNTSMYSASAFHANHNVNSTSTRYRYSSSFSSSDTEYNDYYSPF